MASVQVRNQCESGMFKQLKHNLNQNLTTFFLLLSGKWDFSKLPLFKCRRLKWLQGWPPCKHKCFEISFIVSAIVRSAYYIFFCSVISMRLQASQGCIYTTYVCISFNFQCLSAANKQFRENYIKSLRFWMNTYKDLFANQLHANNFKLP